MQRITILRRLSQIGFAAITGKWLTIGWLRCPFGVPFVSCPSCPLGDCPGRYLFVPFLIVIGVISLLFGRAFCGWVCPMGLVEDALGKTPKPKANKKLNWVRADRVLKWGKWVALAAVVWAAYTYNYQTDQRAWEYVVRAKSMFSLQSYQIAWGMGGGAYKIRFVILMLALSGALFVNRFWCRYFCPLGAMLSVFNKFAIFRLRKDKIKCTECAKYPKDCIQYTCPETSDCIVCGDCVQGCPSSAITADRYNKLASKKQPL